MKTLREKVDRLNTLIDRVSSRWEIVLVFLTLSTIGGITLWAWLSTPAANIQNRATVATTGATFVIGLFALLAAWHARRQANINSELMVRMSQSQIDDNVISSVNSILLLLEKTKGLTDEERVLLVELLNEWDYFRPPDFIVSREGPSPDKVIGKLRQHFNALVSEIS